MNIKQITDDLLCSGCGTCNAVCNKNAIRMEKSQAMGLLYAKINSEQCVRCGICLKVCPSANILQEAKSITKKDIIGDVTNCYIGRALDKEIFTNAQSGGLVTTILQYLFDNKLIDAVVSCRMDYGFPIPVVHHTILTNSKDLQMNQKSCYTQVDIVSALKETSQFKSIAIVGLPCHIQGVSNIVKLKKFHNVKYKIGLICDKSYTDTYMNAIMYGNRVPKGEVIINYRKKDFTYHGAYYPYQQAPTVILNKRDEILIIKNNKRMFMKDFFALPKCRVCWDKLNSTSDIVLGDPWGLDGKYDYNRGDSVIIARTILGIEIIKALIAKNQIKTRAIDIDEIVKGQNIEKRINSVRCIDWNDIKSKFLHKERNTKHHLILHINRAYRTSVLIGKVHIVLSKIKKIISR